MKEMKGCELCSNQARIYCDSDQARLCWDCDEKVHSANFLVAKHCRSLLCHVCQTPTPWKASGLKLGPTISVCGNCFDGCDHHTKSGTEEEEMNNHHQPQLRRHQQGEQENNEESCDSESTEEDDDGDYSTFSSDSDGDNDDDDDDDDDDGVEDEEDDGENQVVPWSCCSSTAPSSPQPPLASSCSSEEELVRDGGATVSSTFKRTRHTAILDSDDEDGWSSQLNNNGAPMECEMPSSSSLRPVKIAKTSDLIEQIKGEITDPERRRLGIVSSLIRFQQNMVNGELDASAIIHGISKMSRRNT